ncbi:Gti1/Pac2 family protein [Ilyonectria robusta]
MSVSPTFKGYVASTQDALILFEACLTGQLNHTSRQLREDERPSLVVSGNVFVYEQHSSGIIRWADGIRWGAPEVVNDFHLYQQSVADLEASECAAQQGGGDTSQFGLKEEKELWVTAAFHCISQDYERSDDCSPHSEICLAWLGDACFTYVYLILSIDDRIVNGPWGLRYAKGSHNLGI